MGYSEAPINILLVSYPAQGHINPMLRLGKCLASKGSSVIFITTEKAGRELRTVNNIIDKSVIPVGNGSLAFEFFEDGLSDDDPIRASLTTYLPHLELVGKKFLSQMIKNHAADESNTLISCIINNPFLPWVSDVAAELEIPSALLWIQSGAVFAAYYNYFHKLVRFPSNAEPYIDVQLSSLVLKYNEIPDFLHCFSKYPFLGSLLLEQIKNLSKVFCVLVDTYEELEHDFINYISKYSVLIRPIGPLFQNPKTKTASNICGDLVKSDDDCIIEWLNSRPQSSVVYISFGTIVHLPQEQVNEIAYGLLDSQVSFLWILKVKPSLNAKHVGFKPHCLPDGFLEETSGKGKVAKWCPQEQVLAHPSVACFMTHCGWNSSMEALTLGVPMLTFPAWGDQVTNAKFLVDVFEVGVRLGYSQAENRLVCRDEVKKCLLEAMAGPKAEMLKQNTIKWKKAAEAAVAVGGSSDRHIDAFMEDIKTRFKRCNKLS
ncbi:putative UDP-glucose glucosyltransferase [Medicago truncatula]|uniref:Glycosyltransferase n=1 Tax=Medicago truncatula TaxID=3880 RepID=A0A072TR90_MEDTR|nr:putative UDP-glucose glucosyltransferase [Medicago truncatula]KEH20034.1 limonoid UDP-glucosyltransferase-like protein [Medicago truncatula]